MRIVGYQMPNDRFQFVKGNESLDIYPLIYNIFYLQL